MLSDADGCLYLYVERISEPSTAVRALVNFLVQGPRLKGAGSPAALAPALAAVRPRLTVSSVQGPRGDAFGYLMRVDGVVTALLASDDRWFLLDARSKRPRDIGELYADSLVAAAAATGDCHALLGVPPTPNMNAASSSGRWINMTMNDDDDDGDDGDASDDGGGGDVGRLSSAAAARRGVGASSAGRRIDDYYDDDGDDDGYDDYDDGASAAANGRPAPRLWGERPPWQPDALAPECSACGQKFTATRRKHHCRACGFCHCDACTPFRVELPPSFKYKGAQRVCRRCHNFVRAKGYAVNADEEERAVRLALEQSRAAAVDQERVWMSVASGVPSSSYSGGGGSRSGASSSSSSSRHGGGGGGGGGGSEPLVLDSPSALVPPGERRIVVVPLGARGVPTTMRVQLELACGGAVSKRQEVDFVQAERDGDESSAQDIEVGIDLSPASGSKAKKIPELETQALAALRRREPNVALESLWELVTIDPSNASAWYNMACAESVAGAPEAAINHLRQAFECGYLSTRAWHTLETDRDLAAVRRLDEYARFSALYRLRAPHDASVGRAVPPLFARLYERKSLSTKMIGDVMIDLSFLAGAVESSSYCEGWYNLSNGMQVKLGVEIVDLDADDVMAAASMSAPRGM